ncbi:VOC family protein [Arthrobacter sp. Cr_A7]|uniref:VOC family protein n=1 Tax=Arthrobacter sp. Cr_A7 TaxID=3031017 RepID=UPI0023D9811A|nr:VOC family protein [Arthrobacter sp. Cr_A7]MDF2052235.1 VOC family protein [Arthrobacter sp. Cr_A7]
MISTLFHVNLVVRDMATSVAFYQALGFTPVGEATPEGEDLGAPLGTTVTKLHTVFLRLGGDVNGPMLDLVEILEPRPQSRPYPEANHLGIARVAFWALDLHTAIQQGESAGGKLLGNPTRFVGPEGFSVDTVCFADPDGIFIQIFSPVQDNFS